MPEKPVIASNLHKSFENNEVLCGVYLEIPPGAVVGLIGTNGSGKSTLIKCLLGLLKPTSGSTSILGESAWDMSAETKSRLCYVPQEVSHYPWMKVRDIIDYTAAFYPNWDAKWTQTLVDRWAIPLDSVAKTLSAGQAQKLALVLGMGHRPDLMIFDEPVASLDPVGRREFLRSILDLTADAERTLLFSTHITSDLERVASHVAILRDGRIQYFDELDVLKDQFKRLRIHADGDLPESFQIAGSLKTEVRGGTAVAAVPNVSDAMLSSIRSEYGVDVRVEDLNLEEIFVELHHG